MNTRLGRYCERVVEAGWLAAAAVTPLYFNIYSSRVFEPDKLTLLRSIALVVAAAWLIRTAEQLAAAPGAPGSFGGGEPLTVGGLWRSLQAVPLGPQVLLLVLVYLLATAASVAPHTSFWGSYQRLQGTYTFLAYVVIYAATWQTLRTRAQLERLLNVIVLASLPVALYGVLQHYGLDPLPWAGDVQDRVTGNLGNAIFIAAYLIMPFFVTLERVVARFRRLLGPSGSTLADAFAGGAYLFILALQALAIYFSKSRGPWLGLLAGAYVFVLITLVALRRAAVDRRPLTGGDAAKAILLALLSPLVGVIPAYLAPILRRRGSRWLWLSWCLQSLLALAFLIAFNLPHSPLAPLREVPGIGRLGQVFETEAGTGRVRVLIWGGAVEMLKDNPARTLVGYGPESMYVAFNRFYPPDLAHYESRSATPDRAHNETFDALITTGIGGFLVYMALFVGILYHGLRWLGFLPDGKPGGRRWARAAFLALTIGGGLLGALVPLAVDGSLRFAGVGIPAGLIAGVAVYMAASALANVREVEAVGTFGPREVLLAGLLAMIVAHFVEIHFGIAISATRLYYWLGLALLLTVGSGRVSLEAASEAPPAARAAVPLNRKRSRRRRAEARAALAEGERSSPLAGAVAAGLIVALILGTLLFDLATNTDGAHGPLQVIWLALTAINVTGQEALPSPGILAMAFLTWALGALLLVVEAENAPRRPDRAGWRSALGSYLAISLGAGLAFGLLHAAQLQAGRDLGLIVIGYYAFAGAVILLAALFLPGPRPAAAPLWRRGWGWVAYPLILAAAGTMVLGNANVVRADIYYKQAWDGLHRPASEGWNAQLMDRATVQRYYQAALRYYDRAIQYAPTEDYYLLFRGKALLELSALVEDPEVQRGCLVNSEVDLHRARQLNPLNTDHTANLARLCHVWAGVAADDAARQERLEQSIHYYQEAARLSPQNAVLYNEWARTYLDLGRADEALATFERSLALDDRYAQTYLLLGEFHAGQGQTELAIASYRKALELEPKLVHVHSLLGQLYAQQGDYAAAIEENLLVLEALPQDYASIKNLAILYQQTGQLEPALAAAIAARELAPEADQEVLDRFIAQLESALDLEPKP